MSKSLLKVIEEMTRPVARGSMPAKLAYAAIAARVAREFREGTIEGCEPDPEWHIKMWAAVLKQRADNLCGRMDEARGEIRLAVIVGFRERTRPNAIAAQAHDINGRLDFPLTEADVMDLVRATIESQLRKAKRG